MALLLAPTDLNARQPLELIERAQTLAPQRPELDWVHLTICERFKCEASAQITAHLQALDPDNGFAWAPDLARLPPSDSAAVTAVITRIGAARRMTIYWNQLEVMMVDALAVASPSQDLFMRGIYASGILAAEPVPALQAIARACRRAEALLGAFTVPPEYRALRLAVDELAGERPNIDFALAAMTACFRLPPDAPLVLFALARSAGWLAHAMEQASAGHLIRPRAKYVGQPVGV